MASSGSTPYRKTVFLAGMASYLDAAALGSTGFGLVLYEDALGIGPATLGLLSGILTITFAIGAFFGGRLGDRYGRRRVFTVSLVFYVAGKINPIMIERRSFLRIHLAIYFGH